MKNFRQPVAASALAVLLIALAIGIYHGFGEGDGLEERYGLTPTISGEDQTLIQTINLNSTTLMTSINGLSEDISDLAGASNALDLVGNLLSSGLGIIKTVFGIIIFIPETLIQVLAAYNVPEVVGGILVALVSVYIGFILVSAYLQREV